MTTHFTEVCMFGKCIHHTRNDLFVGGTNYHFHGEQSGSNFDFRMIITPRICAEYIVLAVCRRRKIQGLLTVKITIVSNYTRME